MLRSVIAVLAGAIAWPALFLTANQVIFRLFRSEFRDDMTTNHAGILLLVLVLSVVCSVAAGWITAAVATRARIGHAAALGVLQLAIGIFTQMQYWDAIPLWYHLPFLALLLPGNVLGGWLRERR